MKLLLADDHILYRKGLSLIAKKFFRTAISKMLQVGKTCTTQQNIIFLI